jgi:hypothetical protein
MFWPLQSSSKVLRVPEDSQVPISGVWMLFSQSSKSGVATMCASSEEDFWNFKKLRINYELIET